MNRRRFVQAAGVGIVGLAECIGNYGGVRGGSDGATTYSQVQRAELKMITPMGPYEGLGSLLKRRFPSSNRNTTPLSRSTLSDSVKPFIRHDRGGERKPYNIIETGAESTLYTLQREGV